LQRRALHRPAGIARVIVKLRQNAPALVFLASEIRLAGFALRVEGVELLLEPFLRGFAGVDGAADLLTADGIGGRLPSRLARQTTSLPTRLGLRITGGRALLSRLTHPTPPCIATGRRRAGRPSRTSRAEHQFFRRHRPPLASPKNRGPDQPAPVIFRAMLVSDRWSFPSNSKPSSVTTTAWVRPCHSRTRRAPGMIRGFAGVAIEISQRSRQAIDLVDDDQVNLASANVVQQPLQRRAIHRAPGIGSIIVERGENRPTFVL